jgi:hypothetical protein
MRRGWLTGTVAGLVAVAAAAVAAGAVPATAGAAAAGTARAAATCPAVSWGSLAKNGAPAPGARPPTVRDVRSGRHACFDRLVVDLAGREPGFTVRYVGQVTEDGSGRVVRLRGGARLQVTVYAPAYDADGDPTYTPANRRELTGPFPPTDPHIGVTGYRTFRQVAWAGTFEGSTTAGLGVRARLPFRVLQLPGPGTGSRVVIDVAHTW